MAVITLNPKRSKGTIHKHIYGHFSEHLGRCIYQGIYVGENSPIPNIRGIRTDVVEAMKKIGVPVLRWPGGCFADEYHWKDGIGPKENRKRMVNTNWGGVVEDNSFGTHEFLDLCGQVGCDPYINANVGSGTVQEMAEWVEYANSDGDSSVVQERWKNGRKEAWGVRFWGVGNESWGCGGNMRPEYYADVYRRYQTYCRTYGENRPFRIACGASEFDYRWTEVLMREAGRYMDGLSLHYYTLCGDSWQEKGSSTEFTVPDYYKTLKKASRMEELISGHDAIMTRYDPEKRVGLIVDEWGTWYDVEPGTNPGFLYQQNTMRDALVAAITLNIFNHHCDRVIMANIAQTVNVLQSIILTEGEKMILTPTYHVFDLFQPHQDAKEVDCFVQAEQTGLEGWLLEQVSASASEKEGIYTVTVANLDAEQPEALRITGLQAKQAQALVLTGEIHEKNDFECSPLAVQPLAAKVEENGDVALTLPPCAVARVTLS
ncbi:MAG: alpha-N-arabinofuranosidase [Clostridia bacterium]|nr:alpha-N-arabinofuranosidase [Clostridia bacterium]